MVPANIPQLSAQFAVTAPSRTIKYRIANLVQRQILIVGHFTQGASSRTNWYRVNYFQVLNDLKKYHEGRFDYRLEIGPGKYPQITQRRLPTKDEIAEAEELLNFAS